VLANTQNNSNLTLSLGEYIRSLENKEQQVGTLYCEDDNKMVDFNNCHSFLALQEKGCYGNSTYDMSKEMTYSNMCAEVRQLKMATQAKVSFFEVDSTDWWKSVPATIIPMSGGIYSDESWNIAKLERDKLVAEKVLEDLNLVNYSKSTGEFNTVLKSDKYDCGTINDTLTLFAVLLADFDHDGIAELLVKGYRVDRSDTCSLGSGNSLGASFSVLLKKVSSKALPSILPFSVDEK
jgi:hypothetical protein